MSGMLGPSQLRRRGPARAYWPGPPGSRGDGPEPLLGAEPSKPSLRRTAGHRSERRAPPAPQKARNRRLARRRRSRVSRLVHGRMKHVVTSRDHAPSRQHPGVARETLTKEHLMPGEGACGHAHPGQPGIGRRRRPRTYRNRFSVDIADLYWRAARPAREGTGQSLSSVLSRASRRYEGRLDTGPRGVCRQRRKSAKNSGPERRRRAWVNRPGPGRAAAFVASRDRGSLRQHPGVGPGNANEGAPDDQQ